MIVRRSIALVALLGVGSLVVAGCTKRDDGTSTSGSSGSPSADPTTTQGGGSSGAATAGPAHTGGAPASGAKESRGTLVSCRAGLGLCSEWKNLSADEVKAAKESCKEPGDVFSDAPCETQGIVGTCDQATAKVRIYIGRSPAVATVADAKEMCGDGTFTPAAAAR